MNNNSKNILNEFQVPWRQQLIFITMALMLIGLFTSRALLSVSMILFVAVTCFHSNFFHQLKDFIVSPFLFAMAFLFLIPLISGLWSDDLQEWAAIIRIKLPLLFLPVAFVGKWQLSRKQWNQIAWLFVMLVFANCCWSIFHYMQNARSFNEGYLRAKSILTPLKDDHVRFSWLVSVAVIICFVLLEHTSKLFRSIAWTFILTFAVYLHILAARTGLISLYIT
ncbi:MAG: hypothetical protein ICV66_10615, partial [Chitinophagaceae bacterium]|nr:hypothetical protein [Chitinophagaceae bacterium]